MAKINVSVDPEEATLADEVLVALGALDNVMATFTSTTPNDEIVGAIKLLVFNQRKIIKFLNKRYTF